MTQPKLTAFKHPKSLSISLGHTQTLPNFQNKSINRTKISIKLLQVPHTRTTTSIPEALPSLMELK